MELIADQLVNKVLAIYIKLKFVTVFTRDRHRTLSYGS